MNKLVQRLRVLLKPPVKKQLLVINLKNDGGCITGAFDTLTVYPGVMHLQAAVSIDAHGRARTPIKSMEVQQKDISSMRIISV